MVFFFFWALLSETLRSNRHRVAKEGDEEGVGGGEEVVQVDEQGKGDDGEAQRENGNVWRDERILSQGI